jgi:hypothetical protein
MSRERCHCASRNEADMTMSSMVSRLLSLAFAGLMAASCRPPRNRHPAA